MNYEQAKREADLREARRNPPAHEMTMRDEFAARAMQGVFDRLIAATSEEKKYIAMHAYKMADAMLEERKQ